MGNAASDDNRTTGAVRGDCSAHVSKQRESCVSAPSRRVCVLRTLSKSPFFNAKTSRCVASFLYSFRDNNLVSEYVDDIRMHWKAQEAIVHNYMPDQPDINSRMRAILTDWVLEVSYKYK